MRVLGIDPGLKITGYGCIEGEASESSVALIEAGCFRLDPSRGVPERLVELESDLVRLVERVRPGLVCVESLFSHHHHPRTAIVMAHARGVILMVAARAGLPLRELAPRLVKKALTGSGAASKGQMQRAVASHMNFADPPEPPDVADALAVALCGLRRAGAER